MFANAPADERGDGADVPYGCLLIRTATDTVLVDTGIGDYEHPLGGHGGNLEAALAAEGVAPDDVSVVVITHAHLDHIGGLCPDGEPRFAGARHVISRVEWDWSAQRGNAIADAQLPPLERAGVVELVDPPAEPVPGLRLLAAPGHTPGHVAVEIAGEVAVSRRRHRRSAPRRAPGLDDGVRRGSGRERPHARRATRPGGGRRAGRRRLAPMELRARRARGRRVPASRRRGPSCAGARRCRRRRWKSSKNAAPASLRSNRTGLPSERDERLAAPEIGRPARRRGASGAAG